VICKSIDSDILMRDDTNRMYRWVFSDRLPEYQKKGHSFYVTNKGVSNANGKIREVIGTELPGYTWQIRYGDGTGASGIVFKDEVRVGPVSAPQQAVEAATQISAQFYKQHSDGLLGLGFGKSNTIKPNGQKTFFENIKDSLQEPLFTVSLKRNATGTYDFGYIDKAKYQGPIQYVPINTTRGYWEYAATGYQVGNNPVVSTKFQAIADTGTTLMLLPPQTVKDYYASVPEAKLVVKEGGYVYPCSSISKLPDLTMSIGDARVHVPGRFVDRGLSATGSGLCYGGIQNGSPSLSIWGDIFLKSQFAIFDGREPPRLGFAHQAVEVINPIGKHDHMLQRGN
jgi:aspergillopepsin I